MTLNSLRPYVTKLFIRPLSNIFGFLGFTPNLLSAISLIFAILAGLFFYFKYILIAGLMVFLNSLFDAVDGELARNKSSTSLRGD
ncbi:MAG TPA: CDP-alcohol phosphatidyltransferase family protein, partial [Methanosarcinales archaeon]|nr:CDP-alcohol phosphatidyltransferase family protein [Methanosarcinales archaeon]